MHPQLSAIRTEFERVRAQLAALGDRPDRLWRRKPASDAWSATECIEHLNLTSVACLPILDDGIERARGLGGAAPRRYRRDLLGWLIARALPSSGGMKSRTAAAFEPATDLDPTEVRARFEALQDELVARLAKADGLPLQRVKIASPFDSRVRYNLYSAFAILARHQARHLVQAERALAHAAA